MNFKESQRHSPQVISEFSLREISLVYWYCLKSSAQDTQVKPFCVGDEWLSETNGAESNLWIDL